MLRFFEYRCEESHDSAHAYLWYRSHQFVLVKHLTDASSNPSLLSMTAEQRAENGEPLVYRVQWLDGFEDDAFEDELLMSPSECVRPGPPKELRGEMA